MTEPIIEGAVAATTCSHGFINGSGNDINTINNDLDILTYASSKKVKKKAMARMEKLHRKYIRPEGTSSLLASMYGFCATNILNGDFDTAYSACEDALKFQFFYWNERKATKKELWLSKTKIFTVRGLVLHVTKRIPCDCLKEMYQEAKKKPRTAYCAGCQEEKLFSEMKQCSGCKLQLYCCVGCQQNHWMDHSDVCQSLKRNGLDGIGGLELLTGIRR